MGKLVVATPEYPTELMGLGLAMSLGKCILCTPLDSLALVEHY